MEYNSVFRRPEQEKMMLERIKEDDLVPGEKYIATHDKIPTMDVFYSKQLNKIFCIINGNELTLPLIGFRFYKEVI